MTQGQDASVSYGQRTTPNAMRLRGSRHRVDVSVHRADRVSSTHGDAESSRRPSEYGPPRDGDGVLHEAKRRLQVEQCTNRFFDGKSSQGCPQAVVRACSKSKKARRARVGESGGLKAFSIIPHGRL